MIKEEDTYEELKQGYTGLYPAPSLVTTGLTHAGAAMTHAGTAMTPAPPRVTVNAGTSPIWRNVGVRIICLYILFVVYQLHAPVCAVI